MAKNAIEVGNLPELSLELNAVQAQDKLHYYYKLYKNYYYKYILLLL